MFTLLSLLFVLIIGRLGHMFFVLFSLVCITYKCPTTQIKDIYCLACAAFLN